MKASADIDTQETPAQVLERVTTEAAERCHHTCSRAKEIVKKNPIPTIAGALVFGAAVGYLVYSRRDRVTIPDRLLKEANGFRRALGCGSDRLSSLVHEGVDAASQRARQASRRASDYLHDLPTDDILHSVSDSLNRLGNRLKFW